MKHFSQLALLALSMMLFVACGGGDDPVDNNGNSSSTETKNVNSNLSNPNVYTHLLEFPKVKGGSSLILVHSTSAYGINYSVEWDTEKKSQRWSCYELHNGNNVRNTTRYTSPDDQYPQDPLLAQEYRFSSDPFWGSGYDHGHICPSADRLCSAEVNKQTFYLTNMQPQLNAFNTGIWESMESWVRGKNTNSFRDTLYVVKGGTIDRADYILKTLDNGLIVPKYYFCAVLCKNSQGYKAIGLWFEHKANSETISKKYVVNIDKLEELTGIDFFCNLPDDIEDHVESLPVENVCRAWGF